MASPSTDSLPIATMLNMVQTKLEPSTYLMWRRQVTDMAECFELMGFLEGIAVAPPPSIVAANGASSPNPAFLAWRLKDRKLLSVINASLTPAVSEVLDCTTSHAAWSSLQAVFSDASASHTHALRDELLTLRKGDMSVEEYGRKFQYLCIQLSAIERPIDDEDKRHWFLRGLGVQFAGFADTRLALSSVPSFRDLLHQAKQFEAMFRSMDSGTSPQVAFMAAPPLGYRSSVLGPYQASSDSGVQQQPSSSSRRPSRGGYRGNRGRRFTPLSNLQR